MSMLMALRDRSNASAGATHRSRCDRRALKYGSCGKFELVTLREAGTIEFVREVAHGNRDGDALRIEAQGRYEAILRARCHFDAGCAAGDRPCCSSWVYGSPK
jgi:hypothetical protein